MDKGVYVLLIETKACTIKAGSLGSVFIRQGWHAYVGSALGTGGFARVQRHLNLNRNKDKNPRWHIDYLLLSPLCSVKNVYCIITDKRLECVVAAGIEGEEIPHFGSSDCSCKSHLFYFPDNPHKNLLASLNEISGQYKTEADPCTILSREILPGKGIV
ncbi:GIY-YIG nuclease family protein [Methanospirillum stamsii]|uniref:DUF123 domain-containing protein n=1 Tax=Methanospirillum stamsii TaxID=1277351 RepID=A0A2V2N3H7_9EURY|nr:GIY-YIG nuclease family protein [Methanospirillum stamsii]PWR71078.1 DUF123 domain-containing protein [Methanospirillum stamsii]